ncbi:MAG: chemotaxis protein CheB, partial [Stellaceae bacterium]
MAHRDIVAVGLSAGGHRALRELAAGLPADLPAALLIAMHLPPLRQSVLAEMLDQAGPLRASFARDGETIRHGHIHIAPPDVHMLARGGQIFLRRGPTENRVRPAIDPLFRSAALAYGPRAIGVILSGALDDGTVGLKE